MLSIAVVYPTAPRLRISRKSIGQVEIDDLGGVRIHRHIRVAVGTDAGCRTLTLRRRGLGRVRIPVPLTG